MSPLHWIYRVCNVYVRVARETNTDSVHQHLVIDVNTCEPVPEAFLEIWHCNSTGVYSGVIANGNGNTNDTTNLDQTWHRGIQQSDEDGVVTFDTKFPGHYVGRAVSLVLEMLTSFC